MKNLLKDKKVLVGGAVVIGVGLLAYFHNKGLKVLASQTPALESGADGVITSSNTGVANPITLLTSNTGEPKILALQNALAQLQLANQNTSVSMPISIPVSMPKILNPIKDPTSQNQPILTPIVVSPTGIAVTNAGTLAPVGISGWLTTIQTGILGNLPKPTILNLSSQIQNSTTPLNQMPKPRIKR